ncbi:hypothetical protein DesfrDRAFT_1382 [Solidesulfovibrio fructosivorans JJ]]|uniref:DNA-binding protein n=1 Tax=Solidesulfovibrio fructosivorans JJ] TaxID=596151 RepID=E1JUT3_SOLFR|nr:hypothetical protein [Solidesulfovibrio fructosivorans]EFL51847.1 hypothetical protein DesfrDRAFT_1382 [Solidesulfovibrio fructosivorans JJ]]
MDVQGPFFTLAKAAEYCGYKSPEHFAELLRGYVVPKFGPKRNRYARSVLDAFMADPEAFEKFPSASRYVPKKVVA